MNEKHQDFLDWYLFKGGLIRNKSEDQCLSELMEHLGVLRGKKISLIEGKMRKLAEKRSKKRLEDLKPKKKSSKPLKEKEEEFAL